MKWWFQVHILIIVIFVIFFKRDMVFLKDFLLTYFLFRRFTIYLRGGGLELGENNFECFFSKVRRVVIPIRTAGTPPGPLGSL